MLDTVNITARNIFYRLLEIFRPLYNNYRNVHTILRELLRTDGYIHSEKNIIYITLDLKRRLDKKQSKSISEFRKIIENKINDSSIFAKQLRIFVNNSCSDYKKRECLTCDSHNLALASRVGVLAYIPKGIYFYCFVLLF